MSEDRMDTASPEAFAVLLVADQSSEAESCLAELQKAGLAVRGQVVLTVEAAKAQLAAHGRDYEVVVSECRLADGTGRELLQWIQAREKPIPVILMNGESNEATAYESLRQGAFAYLAGPQSGRLPLLVRRAGEAARGRREQERLWQQLRHAQKLESVGRLAAGVAHDLFNVLTVIQGHAGLLRSTPDLKPEMTESLQAVSQAAERASRLTNQLLVFSRKNAFRPCPLNLNDVLTNASTLLYRALGEDIAFQFSYAPDLPPVGADPGLIEQAVMNLAVNARDAMPEGGQLLISTTRVLVDEVYVRQHPEARPGSFVCLSFIDTGKGLDPDTLARILEPFPPAKDAAAPSGLGLAVVQAIAKRHQGWMEVQSQIGRGSTFKIFLPPADGIAELIEPGEGEGNHHRGTETILVVEDESPVRWTVKNILENLGYRILEAAAGVDALAIWHQHHQEIALLLTDLVMPAGLNGQELAEKFQAQKPGLRVIYTSGYSVDVAGRGLQRVEGIRFIQKPFDGPTLARAVREALDES